MTDSYDLTNPLTMAMGDNSTKRELTLTNNSSWPRVEPFTGIALPAGQTVVIQVVGDIGYDSLKAGIDEFNALKRYEVITISAEVVADEDGPQD